ncbi:MAG: alpha-2-macroglobulin family protein [Sediminimonas sp.]|uniref:alpha-2-macroglobulin family protein n=1 Tax=Sediminimonas sp. TaxID=2823379 RepID=UPI00286FDC0E|nr:alpha-2-macroglobulin family protein [Sediminimonas sp.]MDR9485896.1 alpha-2-macroglobulin family protein [Sediminimonas sp.]
MIMRHAVSAVVLVATLVLPGFAVSQSGAQGDAARYVPDRRAVVSRDVDFYGSDLQALYDTTYEACETACLSDARCKAFTFNTRSNACFPKGGISAREPYEGALSAELRSTDPEVLRAAEERSKALDFLGSATLEGARDQARGLGRKHAGGKWDVVELLKAAQQRRAKGDLKGALHWTGAALAQADRSELWTEYARLALDVDTDNRTQQRKMHARALSAAVNGALRALSPQQNAGALLVLSRALEASDRGRDMIPALRLAQAAQQGRRDIASALEDAIGKYGFRITGHTVESDAAAPRLCAEFSEPLAKTGVDYGPFVRLLDATMAVQADDRQLCIDGAEHGQRYRLTFRKGLPAASGEALTSDTTLTLYVRDRSPSAVFPGRAYVLPRGDGAALPIETVNLDRVDLTLRHVADRNVLRAVQEGYFGRPLDQWRARGFSGEVAQVVWTGHGDVQNRLNKEMTTRLPMGDIIADLPPGLYALTAGIPGRAEYDQPGATQWFVLSDLGITTLKGNDGLHVLVRGLGDAAPREGAKVQLLSRANRVLDNVQTDAQGHARFDPGLVRGTGGAAPAMVTVRQGDDLAFLSLTGPAFDLSDRGVEGREPAGPVDVFLTTDRGAYRAGETIHATVLARDGQARATPNLPLTAILSRPDGVEYTRKVSVNGRDGGHVYAFDLGADVPRGGWRLEVRTDAEAPALASTAILVEDFLPERIDVDLSLPDGPIRPGDTPPLSVAARYLFGAPGADLAVEGTVTVRPRDTLEGYPGYRFGRHDEVSNPSAGSLPAVSTDAAGKAQIPLVLPDMPGAGRPMMAEATVRVTEGSGRPVERSITRPVMPDAPLIGIKPLFDGSVAQGAEAAFDLRAIGPGGGAPARDMRVRWTLNRVETRYQWYQQNGNWNWEPITRRTRVSRGEARLGDTPQEVAARVDWGRYELVVETLDGPYAASSVGFHAGWYAPADAARTPDMLEMSLDQPGYRSGDIAQLRMVPRIAGKALITVMSDRVISMKAVEVTKGENLVELPVTDEWGAGAYVTASVIRPVQADIGQEPVRALGLAHAAIDPGAQQLDVTLNAPAQIRPRGALEASVQIGGLPEGARAHVTVAAVDLGILNLTGFQSPDPSAHYFGQRRLGVEIRDLYGRLIDSGNGAIGQVRSGGDAAAAPTTKAPPPTEELVAQFSGMVTVGPGGRADVRFDMPDFNGTVRLMAVAWSAAGVGQAQTDVVVRDPVVVNASLPRFLAPNDRSRLLLEFTHADGAAGRMGLDVTADDGLRIAPDAVPSGITLAENGRARVDIPIEAGAPGDYALRVALTTPDGRQLTKTLTLGVRANDPPVSQTRRFRLGAGDAFTLNREVFAGFQAGTGSAILSAGPLARLDAPGLIAALDRYPYGCTEQLASAAMPLLYLGQVADVMGLGHADDLSDRVEKAVRRILTRQSSSGSFGLWRAGSGDFWLDAYVTDFLSRARAKGHDVPDEAFDLALDNLRNRVNYAPDFDEGGEAIAYSLMVLAREGAAAMGDLRYYADQKADDFATPLAQAQLGAALAAYGDPTRADAMFARAARRIAQQGGDGPAPGAPVWRTDYGTDLRDAAGVLALATAAGSEQVDRGALMQRVVAASADGPLSTQESAWSLLAAHALIDTPDVSGLTLDGAPADGPLVHVLEDNATATPTEIRNTRDRPAEITLTTLGVPQGEVSPGGYGMGIERRYFTPEGREVSPESMATGTRLVVVLKITPYDKIGARLMVTDPLPAGFEIDNPNLLRAGDIGALDWLEPASAEHAEFRSDRFLAAVNWRGEAPFRLAYMVRAVSPGQFHHPAASVEDMYRPRYRAHTGDGRVTVTP